MVRGRKPLPKEILALRGTDRRDRDRPSSTIGVPIKVAEIGSKCQISGLRAATDRAKRIYWRKCKEVAALGILESQDCPSLLAYAVEYDLMIMCEEAIKQDGLYMVVDGKKGTFVVPNPAVKQLHSCVEKLDRIGGNFGFSPVGRQRLKLIQDDGKPKGFKALVAVLTADEPEPPDEQESKTIDV